MANVIGLWTADWHLRQDDRIWIKRPEITGDATYGMQQIQRLVEEHRPENLLLGGDIFDVQLQPSDVMASVRDFLDALADLGTKIPFVNGQHDMADPCLLTALHRQPAHVHGKMFELGPYKAYGLDYRQPSQVQAALEGVPAAAQVLMTHQVWRDLMGHSSGYAELRWLPESVGTVLTGDFHQVVHQAYAGKLVVSPGPICLQDIGEAVTKSVRLIQDDGVILTVPLKSRMRYDFTLMTDVELERFLADWPTLPASQPQQGVPGAIQRNLVRVRYNPQLQAAEPRLRRCIGDSAHLFAERLPVVRVDAPVATVERRQVVREGGLVGCIRRYYAAKPQVAADAISLYNAGNVVETARTIYQNMTEGEQPDARVS